MKKREFTVYLVICFGFSWICFGILVVNSYFDLFNDFTSKTVNSFAAFMPTVAIIVLLKKYGSVSGRNTIRGLICDFPKEVRTYGILFAFILWRFLVFIINGNITQSEPLYMLFPFILIQLLFQGGFEEPGWRGFLQPYFEKKYPLIVSILMVSVIWSVWHIPLWFVAGSTQSQMSFLVFYLQILVNSCSLAAIMKITKSVAFCMIYHAWCNAVFLVIPFEMNIEIIIAYIIEATATIIISLAYEKAKPKT